MPNRREFVTTLASAAAGIYVQTPSIPRREVMVGRKRVKVIDAHCHCVIDVADIVKGTKLANSGGGGGGNSLLGPSRLKAMDQQGIDIQALSINGYWCTRPIAISPNGSSRCRTEGLRSGGPRLRLASSRSRCGGS